MCRVSAGRRGVDSAMSAAASPASVVAILHGEVFRSATCHHHVGHQCGSKRSAQGTRNTRGPIQPQLDAFASIRDNILGPLAAAGWTIALLIDVVTSSVERAELVRAAWTSPTGCRGTSWCRLIVRPTVSSTTMVAARVAAMATAEQLLGDLADRAVLLVRADLHVCVPLAAPPVYPRDRFIRFAFQQSGGPLVPTARVATPLRRRPRVSDVLVFVPKARVAEFRKACAENAASN